MEKSASFFVRRIRERKFDMANNENVNKVIFGDQTVLDITDTTATEGDVVSGKTFYKASGERATGNVVIPDISNCYQTTDSTLSSIGDDDYFPFLASQNIGKKKVSWAYIKSRLKAYFDSFYAAFTNTEAELRDTVGWVCKNKLDITLTYLKSINTAGTWSGNAYTHNGVTYTCSFNSEGYLSGITTSGTSSGASQLKILYGTYSSFSSKYPQGSYYKFNGCPSGGASSGGFKMFFGIGSIATHDITSNVDYTFEIPTVGVYSGDYLTYSIEVASGVSMASKTFKPMIRDEANGSSVYESYHKNVEEVIEQIAPVNILTETMPSYVARCLPTLKRNITDAFYNGSLRSEIAAGNFKNVRVGDYIIGQSTGSTYYVAELDWMYGKGDQTGTTYQAQAYGQHHLGLMLYQHTGATRLWAGYGDANKGWRVSANDKGRCPWNAATDVDPTDSEAIGTNSTNITRQYNNVNVSGYMGSFIRERIDAIILVEDFRADFGSANVLLFRNINGNAVATDKISGGQGNWNGCTSGWTWYDRYCDLPSEVELYGSRLFGSAYDVGTQCEQLAMFKNARIHDIFPRKDIWTKAVASSSNAACHSGHGYASNGGASYATWACPLACVR